MKCPILAGGQSTANKCHVRAAPRTKRPQKKSPKFDAKCVFEIQKTIEKIKILEHIYGEKEHQTDKSHDTRYRLPCKEGLACFPPSVGAAWIGQAHVESLATPPLPLENAW